MTYRWSGFRNEYEAALAYNEKAQELKGGKATLNRLSEEELVRVDYHNLWKDIRTATYLYAN